MLFVACGLFFLVLLHGDDLDRFVDLLVPVYTLVVAVAIWYIRDLSLKSSNPINRVYEFKKKVSKNEAAQNSIDHVSVGSDDWKTWFHGTWERVEKGNCPGQEEMMVFMAKTYIQRTVVFNLTWREELIFEGSKFRRVRDFVRSAGSSGLNRWTHDDFIPVVDVNNLQGYGENSDWINVNYDGMTSKFRAYFDEEKKGIRTIRQRYTFFFEVLTLTPTLNLLNAQSSSKRTTTRYHTQPNSTIFSSVV